MVLDIHGVTIMPFNAVSEGIGKNRDSQEL
jgi:hypothetical protein